MWPRKKSPKRRRTKRSKVEWNNSDSIKERIRELVIACELSHVNPDRVFCYYSTGAKTRAYARIWGLGRIWQQTLEIQPAYVLEVISEKFDRLSQEQKDHILIHELLHIPKNFSGALVPHKRKGGVNERRVRELYIQAFKNR